MRTFPKTLLLKRPATDHDPAVVINPGQHMLLHSTADMQVTLQSAALQLCNNVPQHGPLIGTVSE